MFSRFFIDKPIFAAVISLLIVLLGGVSIFALPIDRFPEITPPSILISASYPGADAVTASESVAAPIEQQLSGIENLIYYSSTSANNGDVDITATFEIGTDQDLAAVEVQNRLSVAEPLLPQEVIRNGIPVIKSSSSILSVITLQSENPAYDETYLSNYATINLLDRLRRVDGVGDLQVFGAKDYSMRIWLDPDRLAVRNLTVSDVAAAIREQNAAFPAGTIGQRPNDDRLLLTLPVLTRGRLSEVEEYEDIILRAEEDGSILRLKDVAEIELGSLSYELFGRVNGRPTALLLVYLRTGANALETIAGVTAEMESAAEDFPQGIVYRLPYDTTTFISSSMMEVVKTLAEAVVLVLIVVFVFLQNWRAALIPLLAVPVSIIGTFAGMLALGFTINTLTLFGLVLAIGIVVDDAIVVVENVERIMEEEGLNPRAATIKAMNQVSGALVAIVLVLSSVFIPVIFLGGLTGQLYRQFAVTIAVSVAISGLVALTLSPALCRLLLKREEGEKNWFFRGFNSGFEKLTGVYTGTVRFALNNKLPTVVLFLLLCAGLFLLQRTVPTGFLPEEDQGVVLVYLLLPDGASLDRTDVPARELEEFFLAHPAVDNVTLLSGFDILSGGISSTNSATFFVSLTDFEERQSPELSAEAVIAATINEFREDGRGRVVAFNPPSIPGLGQRAGFQMELQQRGGGDIQELARVGGEFIAAADASPLLEAVQGTLRVSVPQLFIELNREKAKMMGVLIGDIFEALQAYLGALYVNDFIKFGRIWRVQIQAKDKFRDEPDDIGRIYVRNDDGQMVPLSGVLDIEDRAGPNVVTRFNGYPAIQVTGAPVEGESSGTANRVVEEHAAEVLPSGFGFEWSGATFQEIKAGNQAPIVLAFGLIVVFLVLAAQYERWSLPLVVLLATPIAVLGALLAVSLRGLSQDIYFQIGLLTLVGLSAKNAILIVEFCSELVRAGVEPHKAAVQAARLRFRPIVMTSLAFILGVLPLATSTGAGAAARHSIGTGVIGGMLAATFISIAFVPVFFVILGGRRSAEEPLSKESDESLAVEEGLRAD